MSQLWQWFSMGGYSVYVWPAYGLVGVVLVINLLGMKAQRNNTRQKLQHWFKQ